MLRRDARLLIVSICFALAGCSGLGHKSRLDYRTLKADPHRDTDQAKSENERAIKFLEKGKPDKAESALQQALIADVSYGPAHNNLGKLYFAQGKYYLAAWEFEYAIRLMPHRPECQNNLGLVYEAVGKLDEAVKCYVIAHDMEPKNPVFLGNLARAQLCSGGDPLHARQLLEELKLYDSRPDWVAWANEQLLVGLLASLPQQAVYEQPLGPAFPLPVMSTESASEEIPAPNSTSAPHAEELPLPKAASPSGVNGDAAAPPRSSSRRTAFSSK